MFKEYSPNNIIAQLSAKIFDGDMIDFSIGGTVYPEMWVTNTTPGTTDMTNGVQYAISSLGTNRGIIQGSGLTYLVTSVTVVQEFYETST